jgi:hypothetical protein
VFNDVMGSEVSGAFNEIRWSQMVDKIADAYRLDKEERQQLRNNKAARLVAGLPFVAGCREPLRTGLSHLSLFVLASTEACRHDFDHKPADNADPLIRLKPISHFIGGDRSVLDEGMARLGLALLGGYRRDQAKDRVSGEYNPLNAGVWDYDTIETMLRTRICITELPQEAELFFASIGPLLWWGIR